MLPAVVDHIDYRTYDPVFGLLQYGTRTYPTPEIPDPTPPSGIASLWDNRVTRSVAVGYLILFPGLSPLLPGGLPSVVHDGGLPGVHGIGMDSFTGIGHTLDFDRLSLPTIYDAAVGVAAWAADTRAMAGVATHRVGDIALNVVKESLYLLAGDTSCFPTPEAGAKAARPTLIPNTLSDPDTAPLTKTYQSEGSPAAQRIQAIVDEASIVWTGSMATPVNTVTMDIIVPDRSLLVDKGPIPQYVMKDKDGRLWVPFYGPNGHLIRYLPVPSAGNDPASIEWIRGDTPRLEIAMAAGVRAVYDQTVGAFVVIPTGADRVSILSAVAANRVNLALFSIDRYASLDQKNPENKSTVRLEPFTSNGKTLFIATVITTGGIDSTWGQDSLGTMVPLSFDPNILWIPNKDGNLIATRRKPDGNLEPTGDVFHPNNEPGNQVIKLAQLTPTPLPILAPSATSTSEPSKTPDPTKTPTVAPTLKPTEIPRPDPVVVALYGDPERTIDFRTLPPTRDRFFDRRTWGGSNPI